MRASDAERERIAEILRDAVAEGRLDMGEFEQRLELAYAARTRGELTPLVRDLPVSGAPLPDVGGAAVSAWSERIGGEPTSTRGFAFWGGFSRKGRWTVGRTFTSFVMWGGGVVDLREARFAEREVTVRCVAIMGGTVVTLPPDVHVRVEGTGFMGGFDERSRDEDDPAPDAPRVTVTGFALMGGVGVERKWSRAERRRRKEAGARARADAVGPAEAPRTVDGPGEARGSGGGKTLR
ncbi:DUF1707 domain-containing protein [Streptomyces sp. NPDC060184]|uniref:DUF1707 SHOCT-like domain-containing protein n=1 Tax=Streptomyces sp. NPDC060184 TaxID=3347064 RepID=UPI0036495601